MSTAFIVVTILILLIAASVGGYFYYTSVKYQELKNFVEQNTFVSESGDTVKFTITESDVLMRDLSDGRKYGPYEYKLMLYYICFKHRNNKLYLYKDGNNIIVDMKGETEVYKLK